MRLIFVILFIIHFQSTWAQSSSEVATQVDGTCRQDLADPNDLGFRNTSNSLIYGNQCIDGTRFRPLLNLSQQNDVIEFDNYLHQGKHWHAQVSAKKVAAVYFQIIRFPVLEGIVAAHTQLRFVFQKESPVQLTRGTEADTSNDLVVSFEAAFPVGVKYDFAKGAFPNYPRVAKIMSTMQKQNDNPDNTIEQYDLKLTEDEKIALLSNALTYSAQLGIKEFYNTRRPNCTTEAFDLIDGLPRFQNNFAKFMTVISPDPIAGPSIKALQRRDLILARVQDYREEMNGVIHTLPVPEVKNAFASFLPQVENREWALVTVLPNDSKMTADEKAAIESLRQELVQTIPALIQSYGSVMLLSPEGEKGKGLFLSTMKEFAQRLPSVLRRMNDQLPVKPTPIRVYFVPDQVAAAQSPHATFWDMELPFAVHNYQISGNGKNNAKGIYANIGEGFREAGAKGVANSQAAFMMGAAILLNAQKDKSKVTTQIMAGLNKVESNMNSASPQVVIEKLVVPETAVDGNQHVAMIISHEQNVASEESQQIVNPTVNVQFGPFDHLGDEKSQHGVGSLMPYAYYNNCDELNQYTPAFQGRINDEFLDGWKGIFNPLLQGGGIAFHLNGLNMNLKTQKVTDMQLSITLWPGFFQMSCIEDQNANKQFAENANKAIQQAINKAGDNPLLKKLSPLLN